MPSASSSNRWVFREGRSSVQGDAVRTGLAASLEKLRQPTRDGIIDALIRAGELETALADSGSKEAQIASQITNAVAAAMVGFPTSNSGLDALASVAEQMHVPERLELSIAEGFAYYALHPLAYVDLVDRMQLRARRVAVLGIRSIGATLSAVVTAALAKKRVRAERITVRPAGHPYDRKTEFTPAQLCWIAAHRHHGAEFLVVDEGPGLSGSSFLSVGEALLATGVERQRIRFLCSRQVDPEGLNTPRGAERWRGFRAECIQMVHRPAGELVDMGAGKWRELLPTHRAEEGTVTTQGGAMCGALAPASFPGSWIHMERAKFVSGDGRRLFKFAGLGRYGKEVGRRAQVLATRGFGPEFFGVRDGYAEYALVHGRPARLGDLSRAMVERIADYCAMRATEFRVSAAGESSLEAMARYNYEQEFGESAPAWLQLEAPVQTVLCDGRMQPHEWLIVPNGPALKTDGETHGDDHFFPGPTDIAWDLAGAIVEWEMDADGEDALLQQYRQSTGDDASRRIEPYVAAYAVFRMAYCTMAAFAMRGTAEKSALCNAAGQYKWIVEQRGRSAKRPPRAMTVEARLIEESRPIPRRDSGSPRP